MTRSEFDAQILAMKSEGAKKIAAMKEAVDGIDMQIAQVEQSIETARLQMKTLVVQKKAINTRIYVMKRELKAKRDEFINAHLDSQTSNLAEASEQNILYELKRRGWKGVISKDTEDGNVREFDLEKRWDEQEDVEVIDAEEFNHAPLAC
jgi:hypothetical protein